MKRTALVLALAATMGAAHADELRIGVGRNYGMLIPEIDGVGSWVQDGLANGINNHDGRTITLQYIGRTRLAWLDYGLGAAYRSGPESSGQFVGDACYSRRQFSGGALKQSGALMMADCDSRYHAKRVSTDTFALTFTVNPTWRVTDAFSLSAGLGVSAYSSQVSIEWDYTQGDCTRGVCEDSKWKQRGIVPYVEVAATYGRAFATAYYARGERAPESMSEGNYGFVVGVSAPLTK